MTRERVVSLFDVDDVESFGHVRDFAVSRIKAADVEEFCGRWHYIGRAGSTTWNYGMWDGITLVGVVSYNLPTMPACSAFFGPERWDWVVHMGRLVCAEDAPRNSESRLIALSLRELRVDRPVARAVVSYAAQDQGHIGYVYQATNALYLGETSRTHYYVDESGSRRAKKQHDNLSMHKAIARGWTVHADPPKHRYVYLLGNKTERREARALLKFPVLPYPKAVPA
jgi:hypothetical protein